MKFEQKQAKYCYPHHVEFLTLDLPVPDTDFQIIFTPVTRTRSGHEAVTTTWNPETGFPHPRHIENSSGIRPDWIDRGARQLFFKDHQVLVEDGIFTSPGINGPDGVHDRGVITTTKVTTNLFKTESGVFPRKVHPDLSWK